MGVAGVGHRRKIIAAIEELNASRTRVLARGPPCSFLSRVHVEPALQFPASDDRHAPVKQAIRSSGRRSSICGLFRKKPQLAAVVFR
jgi:hypothetical protein